MAKQLVKPSFYTSDIRSNGKIIDYVLTRFGLCLVTSEDDIYLIKDRHSPKHGPYSPAELHRIKADELTDIPKLEEKLKETAAKKHTWLRNEHVVDLNKGIDYLDLDCFVDTEAVNARP